MTIFFYGQGQTRNGQTRNWFERGDFRENVRQIAATGVNTVVLVPYGFQKNSADTAISMLDRRCISLDSFAVACSMVVNAGLFLVVKPHIDLIDGVPRANISPQYMDGWKRSYLSFLIPFAKAAQRYRASVFCVGTELSGVSSDKVLWKSVIDSCRTVYDGPLTYAATPQEALSVPFWEELDYVGVNAYFPVSTRRNPAFEDLLFSWGVWEQMLRDLSRKTGRKVLLTEIGYMNHDLAPSNPGCFSIKGRYDEQMQANCYKAALAAARSMDFLYGMWWWQWELNGRCVGDVIDYNPRTRLAEEALREFWR